MQSTPYPSINALLDELLREMQRNLGPKLIGLYLGGSLVLGDFDPTISDIDLTAALAYDMDDGEFERMEAMHAAFAAAHPEWEGRIEVCYISTAALKCARTYRGPLVNISPGEPFHRLDAKKEWLAGWYLVREMSRTLFGPPPDTLIEPISKEEFIESIRDHVRSWDEWVKEFRHLGGQAYAILTLCRALHTCRTGEQASKVRAAHWAQEEMPEWADTIRNALQWRDGTNEAPVDPGATYPETVRFVNDVRERILSGTQAPG